MSVANIDMGDRAAGTLENDAQGALASVEADSAIVCDRTPTCELREARPLVFSLKRQAFASSDRQSLVVGEQAFGTNDAGKKPGARWIWVFEWRISLSRCDVPRHAHLRRSRPITPSHRGSHAIRPETE